MDEVIIEDKKYISSKQAAKLTGYAKDYIGQLCREGRVPARLIGRGWYVLETAIQDHRFGTIGEEEPKKVVEEKSKSKMPATWEEPRYVKAEELKEEEKNAPTQNIQDSWREWFDRFDHTEGASESVRDEKREEKTKVEEKNEGKDEKEEETVNIPIHTIYKPLPAELLPRRAAPQTSPMRGEEDAVEKQTSRREANRSNGAVFMAIQMVGILLAVITATLAAIGSGYFDSYVISSNQVSAVAGVSFYNK